MGHGLNTDETRKRLRAFGIPSPFPPSVFDPCLFRGQEDYYGLAAFFSGVQRKDTKEGGRFGGAQSIFVANSHKITNPMTSQIISARVLGSATAVPEADDELITELYLATLSRRPTESELAAVKKHVAASANRPEAYEDLLWTLLNFSEFSYQH